MVCRVPLLRWVLVVVLVTLLLNQAPSARATSGGTLDPLSAGYDLDTNGNGRAEWFVANVTVNVASPGIFRMEGILTNGSVVAGYATTQVSLPTGVLDTPLRFYGGEIFNAHQAGTYYVTVNLYNDQGSLIDTQVASQGAHSWTEFEGAQAFLGSYGASGLDTDADGPFDWLRIPTQVVVTTPGLYSLRAQVQAGTTDIVDATVVRVLPAGTVNVEARSSGPAIHHRGLDGPYNVTLALINATGDIQDLRTFPTGPLAAANFDAPAMAFNRAVGYANRTLDLDGDGRGEVLQVNLTVRLSRAATFTVAGDLWDGGHGREITSASVGTTAGPGNATLVLRLSGYAINRTGIDGPYLLDLTLSDASGGLVDNDSYMIGGWTHSSFADPPARLAPPHTAYLRDTNGDGRANYLVVNVSVNVVRAGGFVVQGSIQANSRFVAAAANLTYLFPGPHRVALKFAGPIVELGEVPAPYNVTLQVLSTVDTPPLEADGGYYITPAFGLAQLERATPATLSGRVTDAATGLPLADVTVRMANYGDAFLGQATTNASGAFLIPAYRGTFTALAEGPRAYRQDLQTLAVNGSTSHDWTLGAAPLDTSGWTATFPTWGSAAVTFNVTQRRQNQSLRFDMDAYGNLDGAVQPWEVDSFLRVANPALLPSDTGQRFTVDGVVYGLRPGSAVFTLAATGPVASSQPLAVAGNGTYDARTAIASSSSHAISARLDYPLAGENTSAALRYPGRFALLSYAVTGNASVGGQGTTHPVLTPGQDPNPGDGLQGAWVNMTVRDDPWAPTIGTPTASPNPREYPGSVTVSATVVDQLRVASVVLAVVDPSSNPLGNFTMVPSGSTYSYASIAYTQLGTYGYTIRATDGVGNVNATTGSFVVRDTTPPMITARGTDVATQEIHGAVNITATATDTYGVQSVEVTVLGPSGSSTHPMVRIGTTNGYYYRAPYDVLGNYTYNVTARDPSGNAITSPPLGFAIVDTIAPSAAAGPDRTVERATVVTLDGSGSTDNNAVANYTWTFTSGGSTTTLYGARPTFTFQTSGAYTITLTVRDPSGNGATDTMVITVHDTVAPTQPSAPTVATAGSEDRVLVTWSPSPEADVVGYNVYRATGGGGPWTKLTATPVPGTTFTDTGLPAGTTYYYRVAAVDRDGNESPASTAVAHGVPLPLFAPLGLGTLTLLALVAGGAAGAAALHHRRRRSGGRTTTVPPPSPGPWDQRPTAYGPSAQPPLQPPSPAVESAPSMPRTPAVAEQAAPEATAATNPVDELMLLLKEEPKKPKKDEDLDLDH